MLGRLTFGFWLTLTVGAAATSEFRGGGESVGQALCRLIETAARERQLPVPFLTRLIWQESSFLTAATSRAGAQGVAQFMPGTALDRGLADPFDPEQAIPAAAHLLSDLRAQFANLGLAAAAYNGGLNRVAAWLTRNGGLPYETRDYVIITGRSAEDWREELKTAPRAPEDDEPRQSCLQLTASLRSPSRAPAVMAEGPLAPWGVQLASNFSKSIALASFGRARQAYASILGEGHPMIIGTRMRSRGVRPFYRVRVPVPTREAANALCNRLRSAGGSCIVLPT